MAGTFAHLTLVDKLCQDGDALDGIGTLTPAMKVALKTCRPFCELGAISPDAPYLQILSGDAARWANVMHYWKTADFVRHAIPLVFNMDYRFTDSQKCLAWLFGYAAHLVTDLTIHPVVKVRVGSYDQNKRMHRICEINQDVYIFHQQGFGDITAAEYIDGCGIRSCADPADGGRLDAAVRELWSMCLSRHLPDGISMQSKLMAPEHEPDPDAWFAHFVQLLDKFVEDGGLSPLLFRNISEAVGVVYPKRSKVEMKYIRNLEIPGEGEPTNYDYIFDRTRQNVISTWRELGSALDTGDKDLFRLANGNLDTGRNDSNRLIFWEDMA